ncbi:hypothetical protein H4R33_001145 [Dimargaris cristalligena]|nr:hypothetical protein H4R33_001145 [Dimargaris cristalligena]
MNETGHQRKEQLYLELAHSLHTLNGNLETLRNNFEVTKQQTTAIQKLTLSHASLFIGSSMAMKNEASGNSESPLDEDTHP